MNIKRFFSTFSLLTVVATSLVISNNYYKQNTKQYSAQAATDIQKSIDLTEMDIYQSSKHTVSASLPN